MNYWFSDALRIEELSQLHTFSIFPARVHRDQGVCRKASERLLKDWQDAIGDRGITESTTMNLGYHHGVALLMPECLPERLSLVTSWVDFICLQDGQCPYAILHSTKLTAI